MRIKKTRRDAVTAKKAKARQVGIYIGMSDVVAVVTTFLGSQAGCSMGIINIHCARAPRCVIGGEAYERDSHPNRITWPRQPPGAPRMRMRIGVSLFLAPVRSCQHHPSTAVPRKHVRGQ